jgi:hypothetical protein
MLSAQLATLQGSEVKIEYDAYPAAANGATGVQILATPTKENAGKSGNRLLSANGGREDTHRKYVRMLEERRKNRDGGDAQPGWEPDDTDLIESTLYLDETTAYQGPLTDDETGFFVCRVQQVACSAARLRMLIIRCLCGLILDH